MTEKIMSLEDVARLLDVSERTILREIKAGKLRTFRVGRMLRFTPEAVEEYIKNQEVTPGSSETAKDLEDKNAA